MELFEKYKGNNIAIYGIGKNAERLLKSLHGYKVVGLIDKEHWGEQFFGKTVFPIEEIVDKVDVIIIAASILSTAIVYKRIKNIVPNRILLYDSRGFRLNSSNNVSDNLYWKFSNSQMLSEIEKHKIISFDIFDTLIMRRVLEPRDIFRLVEWRLREKNIAIPFYDWRIASETEAIKKYGDCSFENIYSCMADKYALDTNVIEICQKLEKDTELDFIIPRHRTIEALNYARNLGKKVILISDMYFDHVFIEKMLHKCGVNSWDNLYISSEVKCNKGTGTMYDYVVQCECSTDILHIGNDVEADIKMAKQKSWNAFLVMDSKQMLYCSSIAYLQDKVKTFTDKLILGHIIARIFNDPFALSAFKGKYLFENAIDFGYSCISTVALAYVGWIVRKLSKEKNALVLFVSRDGYFLKKIYDLVKEKFKLPKSIYFYSSRMVAKMVNVRSELDIKELCRDINIYQDVQLSDFIAYKFGVKLDTSFDGKIRNILLDHGYAIIEKELMRHQDELLHHAAEQRMNYLSYIKQLGMEKYDKVFFVDLITHGTTYHALLKLMSEKLTLLAMGKYQADSEYMYSMLENLVDNNTHRYLYPVLEMSFASREGQLSGIKSSGEKEFLSGSEYDSALLDDLQLGIMTMVSDLEQNGINWIHNPISNDFAMAVLNIFSFHKTVFKRELVDRFSLFDFGNDENTLEYACCEIVD